MKDTLAHFTDVKQRPSGKSGLVAFRQMGSTPMGPQRKNLPFDKLDEKVRPGTLGKIKMI
jgi:hypothetical protein